MEEKKPKQGQIKCVKWHIKKDKIRTYYGVNRYKQVGTIEGRLQRCHCTTQETEWEKNRIECLAFMRRGFDSNSREKKISGYGVGRGPDRLAPANSQPEFGDNS